MNRINPGKTLPLSFLYLFCFVFSGYPQEPFDAKRIEAATSSVVKKVYPACVRLWGFDTVKKVQNSAQFTGVVVTAEGHILTAAHAITPGKIYLVNFPDGRTAIAEGRGRMASESQGRPDIGMVKIATKGAWPYAEMGWSSSLKLNAMCVSIAYPTTLSQNLPSVRFGRISRTTDFWGFMVSTCAMEPGDSGGPLFDDYGRVVGIHSRIDVDEKINYEIPVDLYRKYWTALNVALDYKSLPSAEDAYEPDPQETDRKLIAELSDMERQFSKSAFHVNGSCLKISSSLNGRPQQVYGTVLSLDRDASNPRFKTGTLLVSKNSLTGDHVVVVDGRGKQHRPVIVSRDKDHDLILLYIAARLKSRIKLTTLADSPSIKITELGKFLLSVMPEQNNRLSILGSAWFSQDKKFSSGYFGASATFINKQIVLTRIAPGSPAEKAGLTLQDQITGINGTAITLPPDYGREIMKYEPGDTILIQGLRAGIPYRSAVTLAAMPSTGKHPADHFTGGKSGRRDGFSEVFTHDAVVKPEECGGPVFDLDGKFYGINIARFSRTSCLVISPRIIHKFVLKSLL